MTDAARHGIDGQRVRHAWLSLLLGVALAAAIFAAPWLSGVDDDSRSRGGSGAGARMSSPERAPSALLGLRAGDLTLAIERRSKTGGCDPCERPESACVAETPRRPSSRTARVDSWTLPRVSVRGPDRTRAPPSRIA